MKRTMRKDTKIRMLPGERFTPFSLAKKLQAKAILESSSFKKGRERYSVLLIKEAFKVIQSASGVFLFRDGREFSVQVPDYEGKSAGRKSDILDVLMYFAAQHPSLAMDLPCPAGGIGFLSWDFCARCDTIRLKPKKDPLNLEEAVFLFGHIFLIFDHYTDMIYLLGMNYQEHEIDLDSALNEVESKINDLDFNYLAPEDKKYPAELIFPEEERQAYLKGVESVRKEIIAGNIFQGVLSRRLLVKTEMPALDAYKTLRSNNPSPYLFYLDFGSYQIFGSSPEVHVKVKDGVATIRPIAGTRRRGKTKDEDEALERELLADTKERAEHLMLVDLARNDLGRFCKPGSIEVKDFMDIERYSHVMHIVTNVTGQLKDGVTAAQVIRATFPAGTVSGAPKIRAIEILDDLEILPRRFYAGLVGYMEPGGSLDTCITIRSGLKKDGYVVLQAGAGIVYDSTPERELEETAEKLRALAASIGVEV